MPPKAKPLPGVERLEQLAEQIGSYGKLAAHPEIQLTRPTLMYRLGQDPEIAARVDAAIDRHQHSKRITAAEQRAAAAERAAQVPREQPVADLAVLKIRELEATVRGLRRDNDDLQDALADQQQFFQRVVDAVRTPVKVPKFGRVRQRKTLPVRSAIAPVYDQQFGQFVRPSDTPAGRGLFNLDVFDQRLQRWVDGLVGILKDQAKSYRLDELIIPLGGDQVEGDDIFPGQPWQLELDPPRQVVELALRMEGALRHVIDTARNELGIPWIGLYAITGNHGAVGGRKAGARPKTYSWDWLCDWLLFDRMRDRQSGGLVETLDGGAQRFTVAGVDEAIVEPGGALFFRCAGHEFQAIHGDQIKGWGGLPFYGLTRFDGRSIRLHNTIYRYLLMGHHHQRAEIPNGAGETIVSGDWVGANNLSGVMTAASRPQQAVIFVAEKWGVTSTERIYFEDAESAYRKPLVHGRPAAA